MTYKLLVNTSDDTGLIYKISNLLYQRNLNIDENGEFVETEQNRFFMRTVFSGDTDISSLEEELNKILPSDSTIKIYDNKPKKIILMATKENHCLGDLLVRSEGERLNAEIVAVISNYDKLQDFTERFGIPFHHISHENKSREQHELEVVKLINSLDADYIVLAKYMRILSADFVDNFKEKIINIHHSFLPAFIGANPYKQAFERGVKIIGATSHFVTNDLDEGPIIAQGVIPITHKESWKEMRNIGWDVEKNVLARALNLVLDDRVFIHNNKTILF